MKIKITVKQGFTGLLFENGVLTRELPPGRHKAGTFFGPAPTVELVDLRERSSTIKNQEILTGDKVSVRLSLLVSFRVTDPKAALLNVTNYEDRLYEDVQLSARRFLATRSLDQILKDRNELSEAIQSDISGPAMKFGVTVLRADVKDIIFPGQLRELMNKQAIPRLGLDQLGETVVDPLYRRRSSDGWHFALRSQPRHHSLPPKTRLAFSLRHGRRRGSH
jgi:regulator of protease activity HflC (stomatin/prohibitin superfamily)